MLANVLIESFMLLDKERKTWGSGKESPKVKKLTNINHYTIVPTGKGQYVACTCALSQQSYLS
jgi:hypothetical protein